MPMSGLMANLHQFHILSNGTAVHKIFTIHTTKWETMVCVSLAHM